MAMPLRLTRGEEGPQRTALWDNREGRLLRPRGVAGDWKLSPRDVLTLLSSPKIALILSCSWGEVHDVNEFIKSKFRKWNKQIIKSQVSLRSSKRWSRWCDNFCKSDSAESSQSLSERGDIMLPSRTHGACQGRVWRCSICSHYLQWCFHYQTTENTTGFFSLQVPKKWINGLVDVPC